MSIDSSVTVINSQGIITAQLGELGVQINGMGQLPTPLSLPAGFFMQRYFPGKGLQCYVNDRGTLKTLQLGEAGISGSGVTTSFLATQDSGTVVRYFNCQLTSQLPNTGLNLGDLAYAQDGTAVYVATSPTVFTPVGGSVNISGTPTNGQIAQWINANTLQGLAVTGSGNAVLATSPTVSGLTISDGVNIGTASTTTGFIRMFNVGSVNQLTFQAAAIATASRTLTFPDPGANDSVAYLALAQTFTGNKTFSGTLTSTNASTSALVVDTPTLVVDATNHKVGVGLTAPVGKLHVIGLTNGNSADTDNIVAGYANNLTQGFAIRFDGLYATGTNTSVDINLRTKGPSGVVWMGTDTTQGLRVHYSDATNTLWNGANDIGITADTGHKIHLSQTSASATGLTVDTTTGNVSIGATSGGVKFTVTANAAALQTAIGGTMVQIGNADGSSPRLNLDAYGNTGTVDFRRADTSAASPSAVQAGDIIGQFTYFGYGSTGYSATSRANIRGIASQAWTDTSQGLYMSFLATPDNTTATAEVMRLQVGAQLGAPTGGDKGVGTLNAAGVYWANGTAGVSAGSFGTVTAITATNGLVTQLTGTSDERLKDILGSFNRGLAALRMVQPIRYRWNAHSGFPQETEWIGFSAQNVEASLPEAIGAEHWPQHGRYYLTLNDRALLAAAVNAIQELDARLSRLEVA